MKQTFDLHRHDPSRKKGASRSSEAQVEQALSDLIEAQEDLSGPENASTHSENEQSSGSSGPPDFQRQKSLAETHTEGLQFFSPEKPKAGRGSLLQIYPASVHAEMIRLTRPRTLMGRDLSCDIALEDTAVSRSHAAIESDEAGYSITDLNSRNGTFVDDQLLKSRKRLTGGELIRLGSTIFKFMAAMDEEAQYHAVVHELMTRDPLTSAFNRSFLMSTLEKQIPRCLRNQQDLAIIVIDIDFFKKVNDSHGHLVGDEVLRVFAERLRGALRPTDQLCRLGGEEFVVISEKTSLHDAVRIAERLRLMVASHPFLTHAGPLQITCSLGVATLDHSAGAVTVDQLLSDGDRNLYRAKNNGRNMVYSKIFSETQI